MRRLVLAYEDMTKGVTEHRLEMLLDHAQGMTWEQVAHKHGIKTRSVTNTMQDLRESIGAMDSMHALSIAIEQGWIEVQDDEEAPTDIARWRGRS